MKRNLRALGALASIAVATTTFVSQAQAAPVLRLDLTPLTDVAYTGAVGVDISVSGLTEAVGAYAFNLTYDSGLMKFSSFLADPDTKMGDPVYQALDASLGDSGALVNFNVLAGFDLNTLTSIPEAALLGLQKTSFKLGHVDFTVRSISGFANFGLSGFSLSKYDGTTAIQGVTATGAQLCVSPNGTPGACGNNVPEPTSALLVAAALAGLALTRRPAKAV